MTPPKIILRASFQNEKAILQIPEQLKSLNLPLFNILGPDSAQGHRYSSNFFYTCKKKIIRSCDILIFIYNPKYEVKWLKAEYDKQKNSRQQVYLVALADSADGSLKRKKTLATHLAIKNLINEEFRSFLNCNIANNRKKPSIYRRWK